MSHHPLLIVLLGPTGVGKTNISLRLAKHLDCPIVSSDSRQFYRELKIGTAAPSEELLNEVKHYFIGTHSIFDSYSAGQYELDAIKLLSDLFQQHQTVMLVGGSMMYIDAICKGIDDIPTVDDETRAFWWKQYEEKGIEYIKQELERLDPKHFHEQVDQKNPKRMIHALEICSITGKPFSDIRTGKKKKRDFDILKIGLNRPREELYERINTRVDEMMKEGLLEEASSFYEQRHLNTLNTVGYKELYEYMDDKCSLEQAVEWIKRDTRHYAKKQLTWFKRDEEINWFHPDDEEKIINFIKKMNTDKLSNGADVQKNVSLLAYNTFGIDVKADYFVKYNSEEDLITFLKTDTAKSNRLLMIGCGSNLLFLSDFKGSILYSSIQTLEIIAEDDEFVLVKVGSGIIWDDFVAHSVSKSWWGVENLSNIPGTIGASAVQNIGAYGVEVKDLIFEVETIELATSKKRIFTNEECNYNYRESIFKKELKGKYAITSVIFRLSKKPLPQLSYQHLEAEVLKRGEVKLANIRETIIDIRSKKLPDTKKLGNAGSYFMNPYVCKAHFEALQQKHPDIVHYAVNDEMVKVPAAWLIEQCGWKGKRIGNVGVHEDQALVLVNFGGASGKEVADLANAIQTSVKEKFGIDLHPEVNYI